MAAALRSSGSDRAEQLDGVTVVIARVEADSAETLRGMGDRLRERIASAFVTLGAVIDERPLLLALATDDVVERGLRADEVLKAAAAAVGGGGGGRPGLAQAGGREPAKLDAALEIARAAARSRGRCTPARRLTPS